MDEGTDPPDGSSSNPPADASSDSPQEFPADESEHFERDQSGTDPVAAAAEGNIDLYEIASWEPRSWIDSALVGGTRLAGLLARGGVVVAGIGLLLLVGGFAAVTDPVIGAFTVVSAIPAFGLAVYVYLTDVTAGEPPTMLAATFLLGIVTATFAAVINGVADAIIGDGLIGFVLFYFLVVGPVEETVKLLAVWLYAYRDDRFAAVIDGAVYGAMAGLGFAFIENALYIGRGIGPDPLGPLAAIEMGAAVTFVRALAGPGHVIYSAYAGYYLGLAKFTPNYRVPILLKGIGVAALIHALYNTTVGIGSGLLVFAGLPPLAATFVYILAFDGLFGLLLVRKLRAYREAYAKATAAELDPIPGFTAPAVGDASAGGPAAGAGASDTATEATPTSEDELNPAERADTADTPASNANDATRQTNETDSDPTE